MYLSISVCIYLSRWGDANVVNNYRDSPRDREMSKSLMNVKEKSKEGSETPLIFYLKRFLAVQLEAIQP